jgi:hypothetical protein
MIVPSMSIEELSREILSDLKIVRNKAFYLGYKYRRNARRTRRKNFRSVYEYTSKQRNKWLILFQCENYDLLFSLCVIYVDKYGLSAISIGDDRSLNHYYPHFFQRYNERYVKQAHTQKIELVKRFLQENPTSAFICETDPRDKKIWLFGRMNEGVALGYMEIVESILYRTIKTYVSEDMLKQDQLDDFEYVSKLYESDCDDD